MMKAMPTLPELPSTLAKSPHFQVERVRRHTKDEVERTLAKHDSTMREYWILTCVDGEPMSQRQLSELLTIDASDMVRLIDNLENNNWVTRERDPKDRRRQIVAATKKGTKVLAKLAADVAEAEDRALEASSNKQLKSLRKLSQALDGDD
ncbi:transcriptional regulator SlyA [Corynebacterium afermentans subsp. lipophilum]|nr:transcriptional regulator SlyA [Corynebacterium afermentans subsp. lipophilum]